MKNKLTLLFTLFTTVLLAQVKIEVVQTDSGGYVLNTFEELDDVGQDSALFVRTLLEYQESKQTEKGRAFYRSYVVDLECRAANRELNQFTSDTSYITYVFAKYAPRYAGNYRVRGSNVIPTGDTVTLFSIRDDGAIIGAPGRLFPFSNTYLELRNSDFGETLYLFRDFSRNRRRVYRAVREDGSQLVLIKL